MGFKRDENRGKKLGSRLGGWNPSHKLISREERATGPRDKGRLYPFKTSAKIF